MLTPASSQSVNRVLGLVLMNLGACGATKTSQRGPDDSHRIETLLDLGGEHRFATEAEALEHVEQSARAYIDRLIEHD